MHEPSPQDAPKATGPDETRRPLRVLFLCTGNACRSQMAEGWARHLGRGRLEARSAGIEVHGQDPRAIAVMREAGVDISKQPSTRVDDTLLRWADLVVTVCGHADEHCPVLPPRTERAHWPLEDPARARGSEAEVMALFRAIRDEIRDRVRVLVDARPGKGAVRDAREGRPTAGHEEGNA